MMIASIGGIIYPLLIRELFQQFTYKYAMFLLGAFLAHLFISSAFFFGKSSKQQPADTTDADAMSVKPVSSVGEEWNIVKSLGMNYPLFFIFCPLVGMTFMFSYLTQVMYFATLCHENIYENYDVTILLLLISIVDMVCRLIIGVFMDCLETSRRCINFYLLLCLGFGISLAAMGLSRSETSMYLSALFAIICVAGCYSQIVPMLLFLLPADVVDRGIGVLKIWQGIGCILVTTTGKERLY